MASLERPMEEGFALMIPADMSSAGKARPVDFVIDYYHKGGTQPTLLLIAQSSAALSRLQGVFAKLVSEKGERLNFDELLAIDMRNVTGIYLEVDPRMSAFDKALYLDFRTTLEPSVLWVNSPEGWETCELLVASLLGANTPGHQLLTRSPLDDADVEVSRDEYPRQGAFS